MLDAAAPVDSLLVINGLSTKQENQASGSRSTKEGLVESTLFNVLFFHVAVLLQVVCQEC